MKTEDMLWIGDGFSSGKDQIGRKINLNGKTGVVVSGTDMFISVKWDNINIFERGLKWILTYIKN